MCYTAWTPNRKILPFYLFIYFLGIRNSFKNNDFFPHLFEESAVVHTLLSVNYDFHFSSGYLLHWKAWSVLMCKNKTIHHPEPKKWSTKQMKDPTFVVCFFYLPSEWSIALHTLNWANKCEYENNLKSCVDFKKKALHDLKADTTDWCAEFITLIESVVVTIKN